MPFPDRYSTAVGPFYSRMDGQRPLIGLPITAFHVSPRGVCHGAVIASLADHQSLPAGIMAGRTERFAATINMSLDFISPARLGDWLELTTDLLKATRQFLFTQAVIRNGEGALVARSSAIFKFDSHAPDDPNIIPRLFRLTI
jgi:uncharacterized protein (TIGR00369 family)